MSKSLLCFLSLLTLLVLLVSLESVTLMSERRTAVHIETFTPRSTSATRGRGGQSAAGDAIRNYSRQDDILELCFVLFSQTNFNRREKN